MNNSISDKDFIKCGSPLGEYELHCSKETKEQVLNQYAIIDALLKDLKETEEYFIESKDDVKRRILDYHSVMIKAVLKTTLHSVSFGGKNHD